MDQLIRENEALRSQATSDRLILNIFPSHMFNVGLKFSAQPFIEEEVLD